MHVCVDTTFSQLAMQTLPSDGEWVNAHPQRQADPAAEGSGAPYGRWALQCKRQCPAASES